MLTIKTPKHTFLCFWMSKSGFYRKKGQTVDKYMLWKLLVYKGLRTNDDSPTTYGIKLTK